MAGEAGAADLDCGYDIKNRTTWGSITVATADGEVEVARGDDLRVTVDNMGDATVVVINRTAVWEVEGCTTAGDYEVVRVSDRMVPPICHAYLTANGDLQVSMISTGRGEVAVNLIGSDGGYLFVDRITDADVLAQSGEPVFTIGDVPEGDYEVQVRAIRPSGAKTVRATCTTPDNSSILSIGQTFYSCTLEAVAEGTLVRVETEGSLAGASVNLRGGLRWIATMDSTDDDVATAIVDRAPAVAIIRQNGNTLSLPCD